MLTKTSNHELFFPGNRRAAVTLSFDDARRSQTERCIPILDRHGVRGTFYVNFWWIDEHIDGWRKAVRTGHELGNHTMTHPCSCNFAFAHANPLEDYTLDRLERELIDANAKITELFDLRARTFAYPCGESFVGRGLNRQSYVPVVAKHFFAARGFFGEVPADPRKCDLAHVISAGSDGLSFQDLRRQVEIAIDAGAWCNLVGHEVGEPGHQTTIADSLDELCAWLKTRQADVWTDTFAAVAEHVARKRGLPIEPPASSSAGKV